MVLAPLPSMESPQPDRLTALGTMTAGLAHELRNPLNAAHLQLSLVARRLRADPADTAAALQALARADHEMKRIATLVEELLDFARPLPLELAPGDLRACAEDVLQALEDEAADAQVALALAPGVETVVRMDAARMRQLLVNLVRNAIEASPPGSVVELSVRGHAEWATLTVADSGPGLPAPASRIFEPFFTTKPEGTGLGLSIVHRIVTDHQGEISVRRQDDRTVFTVLLPR
jgi:signal transduction histidine kinase